MNHVAVYFNISWDLLAIVSTPFLSVDYQLIGSASFNNKHLFINLYLFFNTNIWLIYKSIWKKHTLNIKSKYSPYLNQYWDILKTTSLQYLSLIFNDI